MPGTITTAYLAAAAKEKSFMRLTPGHQVVVGAVVGGHVAVDDALAVQVRPTVRHAVKWFIITWPHWPAWLPH